MFKLLKPTKFKRFNKEIIGIDVETSGVNNDFICASLYHSNWIKTFLSKDELINYLKDYKTFKNTIIVATNLGFDFQAIFRDREEIKYFKRMDRGSHLISMRTYLTKNNEFTTQHDKQYNTIKIEWIDTTNYSYVSVENMGKIINVQKLSPPKCLGRIPNNKEELDELITYNIRDAEVSKKYIEFLYKSFQELGATIKPTIAATSLSLFKNKYLKQSFKRQETNDLLELFEGYYGGRTEAFKRGRFRNLKYYDYNSLYPSVMRNEFPDPNSHKISIADNLDKIKRYEGLSLVTVFVPKTKYPLLPHRKEGKLLFPIGTFKAWQSHIELRQAIEDGVIIKKVHKTHYYKKRISPFNEYITSIYELRKFFQKTKNPMEFVCKIFMNSLYGKFGQKFINRDELRHKDEVSLKELSENTDCTILGDYYRFNKAMSEPSAFCIPIWSLYTTAYARLKMYEKIKRTNPYYVDTDSIFTEELLDCSNELGDLKLEYVMDEGLIVRPKFYYFRYEDIEILKLKGVPKNRIIGDKNTRIVIKDIYALLKSDKNKLTYQKFCKFKESLRRKLIPNQLMTVSKKISFNDEKRFWLYKKFNPFILEDSQPISVSEDLLIKELIQ